MKFRKLFVLIFIMFFALTLVACGNKPADDGPEVDPLVPTAISLKVKVAKVQINNTCKLTYAITPATAQGDAVTVTVNNDLATVATSGTTNIILTAGSKTGSVKVTITTSNGIQASKTIKIQEEAVESYPDLNGYNIKLAQAEHALGYYDVKLTKETEDKYSFYTGADREFKIQAWDEIEENYNCVMTVDAYPSDAPWGPNRWSYILSQAQDESPEYDFYVVPDGQIPGFVAGNALVDLTDWYAQYGNNLMTEMTITASTYKHRLYAYNAYEMNTYNILGYNIGLWEQINKQDQTLKEPAQMYLDGEWNYDTFKEYCLKAQTALNTIYSEAESKYYCLSGYGSLYWLGMVNAGGVRILDTTQLKVSITGTTETTVAQTLQEIFAAGAMDPSFQVDGGVATWNAGHSLFNTGDFWFIGATETRWPMDLWGQDTRYGYVPFPGDPTKDSSITYVGTTTEACIVMAAGRDWAYKGFGDECTGENIYRALLDYYNTAKKYYTTSEDYDHAVEITNVANSKFGSQAAVQAYLRVMLGVQQADGSYVGGIEEYGFFEPFVENSNSVVAWAGGEGSFGGAINSFIKGGNNSGQWIDAVGTFQSQIEKSLVESYG